MTFSKSILLSIIILFSICGCTGENENNNQGIINHLKKLTDFDDKKHKAILVMPSSGCSGCISAVEEFVRDNKFPSLLLILTNSSSRKDAVHRLDLVNPLCDYYWDSDKAFYDPNDENAIYPKVIYWNDADESQVKIDLVSPDNPNAISDLRDFLVNLTF